MRKGLLLILIFALSLQLVQSQYWRARMHDPSTIIKCKDRYWVFGTGDGIHAMYSYDLVTWSDGPSPFTTTNYPKWIDNYVKGATDSNGKSVFHGNFWAPDIIYMNNQYYLYYSCSEWGTMTSTIGCVTNKTLDPNDPEYKWEDVGFLGIWSYQPGLALNAIDPALFRDADNNVWMAYGSFNERGIVVTEIDTISGKPKTYSGNLPGVSVANSWTGPGASNYGEGEGATVVYRDGYYYLFYNKGGCCAGVNSTYYVVVGRSTSPTGPYVDKSGKNLRTVQTTSGGSLVFRHDDSKGDADRYYGPGHFAVLNVDGQDYVSFHYYDPNWPYPGQRAGGPTLALAKLDWDKNGWPVMGFDFIPKGTYVLKNANSKKVLDVRNHNAVDGALAWQYAENKELMSQKWILSIVGKGEYVIRNAANDKLFLEASGTNNNETLRLTTTFTSAVNQKFRLIKGTDDKVIIYPTTSDNLFEIPYAYTNDYQVKLFGNTNHDCQRWYFIPYEAPSSILSRELSNITISQNPVNDYVVLDNITKPIEVNVFSLTGQKILSQKADAQSNSVDVRALESSPYILQLISDSDIKTIKFIKE